MLCGLLAAICLCSGVAVAAEEKEPQPAAEAEESPAAQPFEGLKVPEGFEVTLYADDELAHDVYSMTVDARGRVVVAGAGYVRILIDEDGDGRADSYRQFADGPQSGAMGLFFHGPDLICTGDAGLLRYRDRDGDDRADGPPDVFLKVKTGGEHDAHAIHRGPDGWWYLIAGNGTNINAAYVTLPTSPIKEPQAGTLMRLKPDLTGGEVIAEGMRNAYDFTFNAQGDIFTFDSDGEREISLPWYRPTRVFHLTPGADCGWISRSWKRPDAYLDMPPVVGAFGRGSPTGVMCYRHTQFPAPYQNALFVEDWTFGRVIALPLESADGVWTSQPIDFMTARGQFGFAPTGLAVGPDGSLFVSVGGRGTRGSVFRVRWTQGEAPGWFAEEPADAAARLLFCLNAPQPLSSWSRARWVPLATELGADAFRKVVTDGDRPIPYRVRAIEILTELFGGLDVETASTLRQDAPPAVRARAVWSLGRHLTDPKQLAVIERFINDTDLQVVRFALESLLSAPPDLDQNSVLPAVARRLGAEQRFVRQTAARVVARLSDAQLAELRDLTREMPAPVALSRELGIVWKRRQLSRGGLEVGLAVLEGEFETEWKLEAARLVELSLGDVGPAKDRPPVFDGYAPRFDLSEFERTLDPYRIRLSAVYPTGNAQVDEEVVRLLSMLQPYNLDLLDKILAGINEESHPTDDIHRLIAASRLPLERNFQQTETIAQALVQIDHKIAARGLKQDSNWDDRLTELYTALVEHDPALPDTIVRTEGFGLPGHVLFLSQISSDSVPLAVEAFGTQIAAEENYPWSNEIVFVLAESDDAKYRTMIREQFDNFSVRSAVLAVLAQDPQPQDRPLFVTGLSAPHIVGIQASGAALAQLGPADDPAELFAVLAAIRRLNNTPEEFAVRELLVKLLQAATGTEHGYVFGEDGYKPQAEAIAAWSTELESRYPEEARKQLGAAAAELDRLQQLLTELEDGAGDVERGRIVFERRSCARCHGGRKALGPDLAGVTRRFSRRDLLTAMAVPDRDVSSRYQTTLVQTDAGKVYTGIVVYESVDGLILRDAENKTYRIEGPEIELQRKLPNSLMPQGLLKEIGRDDLADLLAYLESLGG